MIWHPHSLPAVPEATAAAVRAAFPKGNLYVDLRTEFGTLYDNQLFAVLYSDHGRPVDVAPWRLALVVVMQYIEGLTDCQAADAVRRCMDWKYALSLELTDPGFDFTFLHDFRKWLLTHAAAQRLLDTFLATCKARGWIKARGTQRTDSTHVLAAVRTLHRLECVLEAVHQALNQLSAAAPTWVQQHVPRSGMPATAYGPNTHTCRKTRANARPLPARSGPTAINSWTGCWPPRVCQVSATSLLLKPCVGFGSNNITAVRSPAWKSSAGA